MLLTTQICFLLASTAAILIGGWTAAETCPRYSIEDLGTIAGLNNDTAPGSAAMQLNALGQVAGYSIADDALRNIHGFVWDAAMMDLPPIPTHEHSQAFALNDAGAVVGVSFSLGRLKPRAVQWTGGAAQLLGDFAPLDISNSGVIVGDALVAPMYAWAQAVKFEAGTLQTVPTLGGRHASARAINEAGLIVGESFTLDDASSHACLWKKNGVAVDLGTLGGSRSAAFDINESRQIVGYGQNASGDPRAMLLEVSGAGAVTVRIDLGALEGVASYALSINEAGDIVGTSDDRAVLWQDGELSDLNTMVADMAGWRLTHARSINDAGQIAGQGWRDGLPRAFLLTPIAFAPDINGDGQVSIADVTQVISAFGLPCDNCAEDIAPPGGDGAVSIADVLLVVTAFGTCPVSPP
jgi:probable HAF family extracellular repeat protein